MSFKEICENFYGFLFSPSKISKENLKKEDFENKRLQSFLVVFYISIILGVAFWYFVFYPEPLYYGVSGADFIQDMPTMLIPDPLLFLLIMILVSLGVQFLHCFLLMGLLNFKLNTKIAKRNKDNLKFKEYLNLYAYSFTPIMFLIPLFTLWLFFFERIIFLAPMYPMFDITIPNIILLSLIGFFIFWQYIIILRINKAYFELPLRYAAIPLLIQVGILILLVSLPVLLNDIFINFMIGGMV